MKRKKTLFQSEGCYVCKKCGETEFGVIIEHVTKSNRGQYKSINHIKIMLKCLQAKEWRDVPDEILNIVKNDLREVCFNANYKVDIKKNTGYHHIITMYNKYIAE